MANVWNHFLRNTHKTSLGSSGLQLASHGGIQMNEHTCLKLLWNILAVSASELWNSLHLSPQSFLQDLGNSMVPQAHIHTIPRSTGLCQLNHLTLEWKLDQLQNTIPPFLQPIQKTQTCSQTDYGKRNPAWTICIQTFEKWHEINVGPKMQSEDMCKQRPLLNVLSAKSPMTSSILFHRLRGVGCFTHLSKTTAFLAVHRNLDSPFLPRGFFHSWWFRIKLSRHSWLPYVEFRLSICTRSALSEPTLLQGSFGGTRWRTLEVCRL